MMKIFNKTAKFLAKTTAWGLSEDEKHYCLVKKEAEKFTVLWQKKPYELDLWIPQREQIYTDKTLSVQIVRPVPHHYIWRKSCFLPNSLTDIQLHQQIIHILKNEQPLALEQLYFDYQIEPIPTQNLNKIILFAVQKSYAKNLAIFPNTVLDDELFCYMRAIAYLKDLPENEPFPPFCFQQKTVQFTENGFVFEPENNPNCIDLAEIQLDGIHSLSQKHLYFLALGAALWNGKASI